MSLYGKLDVYSVITVYIQYIQLYTDSAYRIPGTTMEIIISNSSNRPIYEQITDQIKCQILSGRLAAGDPLPSMRNLAQELRISVITTKRAYNDLEAEGFIETVAGKGCYVSATEPSLLRENNLKAAEEHLQKAVDLAKQSEIPLEELQEIVKILYEGE